MRYRILVVDEADPTKSPIRDASFDGRGDAVDAVWDEVESALHLVRAFGRKQDARSVASRHEELLKGFTTKGKLRDLE